MEKTERTKLTAQIAAQLLVAAVTSRKYLLATDMEDAVKHAALLVELSEKAWES